MYWLGETHDLCQIIDRTSSHQRGSLGSCSNALGSPFHQPSKSRCSFATTRHHIRVEHCFVKCLFSLIKGSTPGTDPALKKRGHTMASTNISVLAAQARSKPVWTAGIAAVTIAAVVPSVSYIYRSYRGYIDLGAGGLPHNVLGWLMQGPAQLISDADTTNPAPFGKPSNQALYAPYGSASFLGEGPLEERKGPRPTVPGYVAPQRQTTDAGSEDMRARMTAFLEKLAAGNPGALVIKPSCLEGVGTPALWLAGGENMETVPTYLRKTTKGEIVHVHPEGSSHVTLSVADAEDVVRKGWAERHRLSGVLGGKILPLGYVLVYAPRDEGEFEAWKGIVVAGVGFVCAGGKELILQD